MPASVLGATIDARIGTLGSEMAATIRRNPRSTILPPDAPADSRQERAVGILADLTAGRTEPLRIRRTLGEGGMGIVHLAEQESMGREVAVKTLREGHRDHASALRLLREAWVTGSLEHPNIVPVYDVAVDASGAPQVVLKRIEGVNWATLLSDPGQLRARAEGDVEEWNIRTLIQVCNAIDFAHHRGIIHRDLKPENVMIGQFGEVYVVDWGIAVSLRDDPNPRIPSARTATELAGTPAYMAPEMLTGDASQLNERTDVYLLGAMLFELAAGRPPHDGATLEAIFERVLESPPEIPASVPAEIAVLCRRAMAREPADRHPSVAELRKGLHEYLDHRESMRLARQAQRRLNELLEELRGGDEGEVDDAKANHLFGECRFGFRAALDTCSTNEVARGGLRLAMKAMVQYEVRQGNLPAARVLLGQMDDAPGDLRKQVTALEHRHAAETKHHHELEALSTELDPTIGSRTRTFMMMVQGGLWTGLPIATHFALSSKGVSPSPFVSMISSLVLLPIVLGFGLWARESLSKTLINRRLFLVIVTVLVQQAVMSGALHLAGVKGPVGVAMNFALWSTASGLAAITIEPWMWPSSVGYALALFAAIARPDLILVIMGLSHLVLTTNMVLLWRPMFATPATPAARPRPRPRRP